MNCAQFGSANANSNSPQEKRKRTYYARTRPRNFARPDPRDDASSRPAKAQPSVAFHPLLFTFVHDKKFFSGPHPLVPFFVFFVYFAVYHS